MTYLIHCPYCNDVWFSDKQENDCKCFRCGREYTANSIELQEWIKSAMQRTKG